MVLPEDHEGSKRICPVPCGRGRLQKYYRRPIEESRRKDLEKGKSKNNNNQGDWRKPVHREDPNFLEL